MKKKKGILIDPKKIVLIIAAINELYIFLRLKYAYMIELDEIINLLPFIGSFIYFSTICLNSKKNKKISYNENILILTNVMMFIGEIFSLSSLILNQNFRLAMLILFEIVFIGSEIIGYIKLFRDHDKEASNFIAFSKVSNILSYIIFALLFEYKYELYEIFYVIIKIALNLLTLTYFNNYKEYYDILYNKENTKVKIKVNYERLCKVSKNIYNTFCIIIMFWIFFFK